jgi:putative transposase
MTFWRLFYHITWATRGREMCIDNSWEDLLHNLIASKATDLGALVYAVGGVEDHVHLVASVPPRIALAKFVGQVKGNTSHFINHELNLPYEFRWQGEYGVVSFGERQLSMVIHYVKNQRSHHQEGTPIAFLEQRRPRDEGAGIGGWTEAPR